MSGKKSFHPKRWGTFLGMALLCVALLGGAQDCSGKLGTGAVEKAKDSRELGGRPAGEFSTTGESDNRYVKVTGDTMTATKTGRVIGIALEAFQGPNPEPRTSYPEQKILCFVNPHTWVSPGDFAELRAENAALRCRLDRLEQAVLGSRR